MHSYPELPEARMFQDFQYQSMSTSTKFIIRIQKKCILKKITRLSRFPAHVWLNVDSMLPLHQAEYSELVETLLSSQRDAVIYQRLADAFNKLTASSTPPTMDRKQKVAFLKSLEEFVANVGGLLCVK